MVAVTTDTHSGRRAASRHEHVGVVAGPRSSARRAPRVVVVLVAAGLAWAIWAALGAAARPSSPAAARRGLAVVEVGPGDTLWTIARRLQPHGDVRPLVDRLVVAHGGTSVHLGEHIAVPAR